jgi:Mg2+ and Co2+ transporter CorA
MPRGWVRIEAAKHTTADGIRRRIAREEKQIRALKGSGLSSAVIDKALDAHHELIRVLSERLDELRREQTEKEKKSVRDRREQS